MHHLIVQTPLALLALSAAKVHPQIHKPISSCPVASLLLPTSTRLPHVPLQYGAMQMLHAPIYHYLPSRLDGRSIHKKAPGILYTLTFSSPRLPSPDTSSGSASNTAHSCTPLSLSSLVARSNDRRSRGSYAFLDRVTRPLLGVPFDASFPELNPCAAGLVAPCSSSCVPDSRRRT